MPLALERTAKRDPRQPPTATFVVARTWRGFVFEAVSMGTARGPTSLPVRGLCVLFGSIALPDGYD